MAGEDGREPIEPWVWRQRKREGKVYVSACGGKIRTSEIEYIDSEKLTDEEDVDAALKGRCHHSFGAIPEESMASIDIFNAYYDQLIDFLDHQVTNLSAVDCHTYLLLPKLQPYLKTQESSNSSKGINVLLQKCSATGDECRALHNNPPPPPPPGSDPPDSPSQLSDELDHHQHHPVCLFLSQAAAFYGAIGTE
ncbi:hypothetical protein CDL15_Pgr014395 [Punica granatum]|uniref:Uncharacterized protein n=1 Tax=Punica granatum TaxID=22663 RepID=A0A218WF76_PUNGR|nr:hypothetical protein CDL15_Pgr014395 [Punica granatum]